MLFLKRFLPGPPFLFGAILALGGLIITLLIPSKTTLFSTSKSETPVHHHHHHHHKTSNTGSLSYEHEALIDTSSTNNAVSDNGANNGSRKLDETLTDSN